LSRSVKPRSDRPPAKAIFQNQTCAERSSLKAVSSTTHTNSCLANVRCCEGFRMPARSPRRAVLPASETSKGGNRGRAAGERVRIAPRACSYGDLSAADGDLSDGLQQGQLGVANALIRTA
jgi:hypothetical protein